MAGFDDFADAYEEFFGTENGAEAAYDMYSGIEYDYVGLSDRAELERMEDFLAALDYLATGGETYDALQDYLDMYGGSYDDIDWEDFREWYDSL